MARRVLPVLLGAAAGAGLWIFGGWVFPAQSTYSVLLTAGGPAGLGLVVNRPGLFVDVQLPPGAEVQAVTVNGRPALLFAPWPGAARRRVAALFRGPVVFKLAGGAGPFRLTGLPSPAAGGAPAVQLPPGWQRVGSYAGQLTVLQTEPFVIAAPEGMAGAREAVDGVNTLYGAASRLIGPAPVPAQAVVLEGPAPTQAAAAVAAAWAPASAPETAWWQKAVVEFYTGRLLDETKLWDAGERNRWLKAEATSREFLLAVWLDRSIQYDTGRRKRLDDVVRPGASMQSTAGLLAAVKEVGGLTVADKLDRILREREPFPAVQL
jgi:hypothetical protein